MKKILLGVTKWATIGVTILSAISGISGIILGVLPAEATSGVLDYLGQTAQNIQSMGYVAFGSAVALTLGTVGAKTINLRLRDSDIARKVWESEQEAKIARFKREVQDINDLTVEKQNVIISQNENIIKQQNEILSFQSIQAQRNIQSKLVPDSIKELYQKQLAQMKNVAFTLTPITKVVTETVEVIKEVKATRSPRL